MIIEKPVVLVVEGKDDEAVITLLLEYLKIHDVQIVVAGGKDNIRTHVGAVRLAANFEGIVRTIGIVRDADRDRTASARSCEGILKGIEKRTDYFLLPGDGPGILEDLCLRALEGHPGLAYVDRYMDCLDANGTRLSNVPKFKMRALLTALQDGRNLDTWWAAGNGVLDPGHAAFGALRQFLTGLTSASPQIEPHSTPHPPRTL